MSGSDGASYLACTCKSSVMEGNLVDPESSEAAENPETSEQPEDDGRDTSILSDKHDCNEAVVLPEEPDLDVTTGSDGERVNEEMHEEVDKPEEMPNPEEDPEAVEESILDVTDSGKSDVPTSEPVDTPRPGEEPQNEADEVIKAEYPPLMDLVDPSRSKHLCSQFKESTKAKPTEGSVQEANDHNVDKFEAPEDRTSTTTGDFTAERKDHSAQRQQRSPANIRMNEENDEDENFASTHDVASSYTQPVHQLPQDVQSNPDHLEVEVPSEEIAYNLVYFATFEINSPLENNAVKDFRALAGPTYW